MTFACLFYVSKPVSFSKNIKTIFITFTESTTPKAMKVKGARAKAVSLDTPIITKSLIEVPLN